ncbi:MAG: CrcB family protein [Rhodococcus sp. (in: high G+C Gram-positive bacteria)]
MTLMFLVAVGGAAAALLHYRLTRAVTDPKRILLLTVGASAVLGFVTAASPPQWFVGLVCFGFLGALSPMTSVALLTVTQVRAGRYRSGLLFLAASVIGAVACAMFGFLLYSSGLTLYRKF